MSRVVAGRDLGSRDGLVADGGDSIEVVLRGLGTIMLAVAAGLTVGFASVGIRRRLDLSCGFVGGLIRNPGSDLTVVRSIFTVPAQNSGLVVASKALVLACDCLVKCKRFEIASDC